MAARGDQVASPTPSQGPQGSDLRSVAKDIAGLLDDDGHFNPNPDELSRGHPDYDPDADPRQERQDDTGRGQPRGADGKFRKKAEASEVEDDDDLDASGDTDEDQQTGDDQTEDTDTGDTDGDLAASAEDDADTDEEETETIETVSALADVMGISVDELSNITHTFNAADEEVTVTLSELVKGYQKDADYRRSTAKLADDRRAAEQDYQGRMQAFEQEHVFLAAQLNAMEQLITSELESPTMQALRTSDPAEWSARETEIRGKLTHLQQTRQQAAHQFATFQQQQLQELKGREQQALIQVIPDWSSDHRTKARETVLSLGYTDQEAGQLLDHRLIRGAIELADLRAEVAELRKLKTDAENTVKRVKKKVPTFTKPGKKASPDKQGAQAKRSNLDRLRRRAEKSGSVRDAAKVIEQIL